MPTIETLRIRQALPLEAKIAMTEKRILDWVREYGIDNVYISWSGGKDSTVLLNIARNLFPNIQAVYIDTGLEYPEIKKFVHKDNHVITLRPAMNFKEVITKYGYPIISKEVSNTVYEVRNPNYKGVSKWKAINGLKVQKDGKKSPFNCEKYKPLLNVDFRISDRCCRVMKKTPVKKFEHKSGKFAILGTMAEESRLRTQGWLQYGCNGFDRDRPISNPMSAWTEQDVYQYIYRYKIDIPSVYGDVIPVKKQLFNMDTAHCKLCTTGCRRTGCIYCGYGLHLEEGETRFQMLKRTHPKLYDYCIGGGDYDPNDGLWKPDKNGLGMEHVFNELNKLYGDNFIRYR